jgi:hypothetical protein
MKLALLLELKFLKTNLEYRLSSSDDQVDFFEKIKK